MRRIRADTCNSRWLGSQSRQRASMRWFTPATVLLAAWGALAFGAEYPWAYAPLLVFGITVGALALAVPLPGTVRFPPLAIALGAVIAATMLQILPLPGVLVAHLSPERATHDWPALYAEVRPAVRTYAPTYSTLSIEPFRTLIGIVFATVLSLLFLGAVRALSVVRPARLARGVIALGVVVAVVGIVQESYGGPAAYGIWYPRKAWTPSAPFINENHFASWMLMPLSLAVGYFCSSAARTLRVSRRKWRDLASWIGSREATEMAIAAFAALVMALSIFVTGSVAGATCLIAAIGISALWTARRDAGRRRMLLLFGLAAVLVSALMWAGIGTIGATVADTLSGALDPVGRIGMWRDTVRILSDFPLAGTGLNTYGIAMLSYQTHSSEARAVEAHNDYLQLAAEGGLLLGLPVVVAIGIFVRDVRRRFREAADDKRTWWLRSGAVTGMVAVGLHESVDFGLQMPGAAVLFVLMMAVAVHRPTTDHNGSRDPGDAPDKL